MYKTAKNNKKNEYIPVVYSPNDKYVPLALTSMTSIADNTVSNIDFVILYSNLSKKSKKSLDSIKKFKNCKITYKHIDENIFIKAGALLRLPYYPAEVYFKMIIPDILPQYDKAIFLDSDTLCLGDVKELFDFDVSNVSLGAVQDVWFPEGRVDLPLKSKGYFNCGVMLYNCKKMRENDFCNQMLMSLKDNPLMYSSSEEGIMNKYLDEDKILLPLRFNYLEPWWNNRINYTGDKLIEYNNAKINPLLIHFTGHKPSTIYSAHSYREKWWYYASKTCCYEELLENFKNEVFDYTSNINKKIADYRNTINIIKNKIAPFV